jgi:FixJ family two-component response regulator
MTARANTSATFQVTAAGASAFLPSPVLAAPLLQVLMHNAYNCLAKSKDKILKSI